MKKYVVILGMFSSASLVLFWLVNSLQLPLLIDPRPGLQAGGFLAAGTGVLLLMLDVILPIPASLIMVAHGALFGIAAGGLLSAVGCIASAFIGHALGKYGAPQVHKYLSPVEQLMSVQWMDRYGMLAIILSRPIPILAESVSILSGLQSMPLNKFLLASALGSVPTALLFAFLGHYARAEDGSILSLALVVVIAAIFWGVSVRRRASN